MRFLFGASNRADSSSSLTVDCSESSRLSFLSSSRIAQQYSDEQENLQLAMALSMSQEEAIINEEQEIVLPPVAEEQFSEDAGAFELDKSGGKEPEINDVTDEELQEQEDMKPSAKETGVATETSPKKEDKKPKKKSKKAKKKKKKKKDSDSTSTQKIKNKKKKSKKKKAAKGATDSKKVSQTSDQAMPQNTDGAEMDETSKVPTLPIVKEESERHYPGEKRSPDIEHTAGTTEPREQVFNPIFVRPGGRLSPTSKTESFPDSESILSKLSEFEQAWRDADNSRHKQDGGNEEPVPPEEEAMSMADTILDSTASIGTSTYGHGQYAVVSTVPEERTKDYRRQAISLAAAETQRRAEAKALGRIDEGIRVQSSRFNSSHHVNWRLPDDADGADQPSSSSRIIPPSQEGKQAYMEGVKATSILDIKRQLQPGAFAVTGPQDDTDNPAEQDAANNMVVAGALTQDEEEAEIEMRIMQRLLKESAQASVILVEHGGNSQKYEDPIGEAERQAEMMEQHKPQGLVEKILGDGQVPVDVSSAPDDFIKRRNHIPFTIKLHGTTNLWVTSVQTSQKASDSSQYMYERTSAELKRSIKTYIAMTEQEAYEIGLAMAPPVMNSYDENPICQLCSSKFALLKRPCQCRNCGVVMCSSCTCSWSSKQVPSTYIAENHPPTKSTVNVCVACDWVASSFREALLQGNLQQAQSLYKTGNVNLRKVYGGKKSKLMSSMMTMLGDEAMYPIQMAIRGGNLSVVKWLMFEHYCPLYETKKGKMRTLLKTSKGRTVIDLALEQPKPEVLKFLVTNQGVSLTEYAKSKENRDSLKHLMRLVQLIPETMLADVSVDDPMPTPSRIVDRNIAELPEMPQTPTSDRDNVAELPEPSAVNNIRELAAYDDDECAF